MKIDTLSFVHCLLTTHAPEVFHVHMGVLVPPVVAAVSDNFYKITAEALLVLQQLVKVIRPLGEKISSLEAICERESSKFLKTILIFRYSE